MAAELGQTTDPVALVPGDVRAVRGRVADWRSVARELTAVHDALKQLSADGVWSGPASKKFEEKIADWLPGWQVASDAYYRAAAALDTYAAELDFAQGQAATAIELWAQGEAATAAARTAAQQRQPSAGSPLWRSPVVVQPLLVADPGADARSNAVALLTTARAGIESAGDDAAKTLEAGIDWGAIFLAILQPGIDAVLDGLATAGNAVASFGQALIEHPDTLGEILGGMLMMDGGIAGEAGGGILDATGIGAVVGVPANIAAAGLIGAGATLAGTGVMQAVGHAQSDSRVEPFKQQQNRAPDGTYTGADGVAKAKEQQGLDEVEKEFNTTVIRDQVKATVDGGNPNGRFFDGLVKNDDGTYTAVEIKSGGGSKTPEQRAFDNIVNGGKPATARLNGETIQIVRVETRNIP